MRRPVIADARAGEDRQWAKGVWVPALGGAAAFWLVNLTISMTPAAADYRSALSISYIPMLIQAAIGGIAMGLLVSWALLRFPDRVPGKHPVGKALVVSLVVLVGVTTLIEVPSKLTSAISRPMHYLLIATVFNALRITALGLFIGFVRSRSAARGHRVAT